jgi:hypothetical protein
VRKRLAAIGLGFAAFVVGAAFAVAAKDRPGYTKGVADAALIAAAKATPLKLIDYDQVLCRDDRTVKAWLNELTAGDARAIVWSGGGCDLTDKLSGIDSGSDWCAQATILLKHPKDRSDKPVVEIYFDKPSHGRPSPAYAFRAVTTDDGLIRFRQDFESAWLARFPANARAIKCPEADQ